MIYFLFALLVFIISSDLNGFISLFTGQEAALSLGILGITVVLFVKAILVKHPTVPLTKWMIGMYLFWLLFGTLLFFLVKPDHGDPLGRIRYYLPSVILLFVLSKLIIYFIDRNKLKQVLEIITVALLINCLFIIFSQDFREIVGFGTGTADRNAGLIASVNQAGVTSSLAQAFILHQYLIANRTKRNRYLLILAYAIAVYAGFLTFSKAAFVNILGSVGLFVFYLRRSFGTNASERKSLRRNKTTIVVVLVFAVVGGFFYGQTYFENLTRYQKQRVDQFMNLLEGQIDRETTTGRSHLADVAINIIEEDAFLGRGLSTFHRMHEGGHGSHNEFLLILGEAGIIGLLIFLGYFLIAYKSLRKIKFVPSRFLVFSLINIMFVTCMVSHTALYVKLYILIYAFINALSWYGARDKSDMAVMDQ